MEEECGKKKYLLSLFPNILAKVLEYLYKKRTYVKVTILHHFSNDLINILIKNDYEMSLL